MTTKEWAIQDELTKVWWLAPGFGATEDASKAFRFHSYPAACKAIVGGCGTDDARIVPAPPREMTDAECIEWVEHVNTAPAKVFECILSLHASDDGWFVRSDIGGTLDRGKTIYDAIRAARRALEAK